MRKYFSYIRVSTQKQKDSGTSLPEQREAIRNYALRNNIKIVREFKEVETAAKRGRQVFNLMISELKKGKSDGLIIHKIDRSARNLKDWALLGDIMDQGIDVRFAHENIDLNSRGGRLSADIQAVVAADFIRNLREETKKGIYGRLRQGLYPFPCPIGYINKGKGIKEPDPERAPLVKKLFELYSSGKWGINSLVDKMYSLGLRSTKDGKVKRNGIHTLLHNPFYAGIIRVKRTGEIFAGAHQPIISKALFDKVQAVLSGKNQERKYKHFFVFRRLIKCGFCGQTLIGERHKGHIYYRCHNRNCEQKTVRGKLIKKVLLRMLKRIKFNELENKYLRQLLKQTYENITQFRVQETKALRLQLDKIKNRQSRVADLFIDGHLDKEVYQTKKNELVMQAREIKDKLEQLDKGEDKTLGKIEKVLELANNAYLSYKLASSYDRRDLVKIITSNFVVKGKSVYLKPKYPFKLMLEREGVSDGSPCRDVPRILRLLVRKLYEHYSAGNVFWQYLEAPLLETGVGGS
jgi:DNA invertase Pin-like site-specific DNA recombinase